MNGSSSPPDSPEGSPAGDHPGHRRLLHLAGDAETCRAQAAALICREDDPLWIGHHPPEGWRALPAAQARRLLGCDEGAVAFDAFDGFDADAFGAVSGAVAGGGVLLLLTPPLEAWEHYPDPDRLRYALHPHPPEAVTGRFLRRLARLVREAPEVERGPFRERPAISTTPIAADRTLQYGGAVTPEQFDAVRAITELPRHRARRPLVLSSDRGRGKSSALGIAAARLIGEGVGRVVVTAPRLDAVAPLFARAAERLPGGERERGELRHLDGRLRFVPPDELIRGDHPAEVLLVDEAAAIPAPLLEALLRRYPRVVFATTLHGYEGSGRGFAVRFRDTLDRLTPGWRELRLEQPIRWAPGDPLERFTFRALLLDAPEEERLADEIEPEAVEIERIDRDRLADDESLLGELFGLLVSAHYRTRPSDVRQLLDGPDLSVWSAHHRGERLGTALVAKEGGFDAALAEAVFDGRRRPHGHLIPQSLSIHGGLAEAPGLRGARVQRIAVHPAARRLGVGRRLLEAVANDAGAEGLDWIGASFGATGGLLDFWAGAGFTPLHLGFRRDHASGEHSLFVLRALSPAGEALVAKGRRRFGRRLPSLLADPLRDLDPTLAARLLADPAAPPPAPDEADRREAAAFAFGRRGLEASLPALRPLAVAALRHPESAARLPVGGRELLTARLLQHRPTAECAGVLQLSGRAAVEEALRAAFRSLLESR